MSTLKAAYLNELYKISKKKVIIFASIFSILVVIIAGIIVYSVNNFIGIRITGCSEFSILVLSVLSYTLIPLFTAFVCIEMFSGEFVEQTIKITLTSPAPRLKVFTAKILAIATFIATNLIFVMLISFATSLFLNSTSLSIFKIMLAYISQFLPILVFALVVITIANLTKGTTSTFMLSVLVFLVFNGLGFAFPYFKSILFTSAFDWYRLFLGSYINIFKILRTFLILCGYGIMFFGIGFYLFDKKEV